MNFNTSPEFDQLIEALGYDAANKLIAAAPDMLKALQWISTIASSGGDDKVIITRKTLDRAREAITKATGSTQY